MFLTSMVRSPYGTDRQTDGRTNGRENP